MSKIKVIQHAGGSTGLGRGSTKLYPGAPVNNLIGDTPLHLQVRGSSKTHVVPPADKPRAGDMYRRGGKTRIIRAVQPTMRGDFISSSTRSNPAGRSVSSGDSELLPGKIIFRWINGHVVPIRVKG